jgi:hypothetical protein
LKLSFPRLRHEVFAKYCFDELTKTKSGRHLA